MPTIRQVPGESRGPSGTATVPESTKGVTVTHAKGRVYITWATPKKNLLRQKRVL